jgi:hypothetical protein
VVRSILENVTAYDLTIKGGLRMGSVQQTLGADFIVPPSASQIYNLDAGGSTRNITLPSITNGVAPDGRVVTINNVGTSGNLVVKADASDGGATLTTLQPGLGATFTARAATNTWVTSSTIGGAGSALNLPYSQTVTNNASGATTAAVGDLTGAEECVLKVTAVGAANYTTRTAAQMFADIPGCYVGFSWMIFVKNTNAGTTTIVGGTGVTITGTATVAQNTTRILQATFTGASALALESLGVTATA